MRLFNSFKLDNPPRNSATPKSARRKPALTISSTITALVVLFSSLLLNAQGTGTPNTLRIKTDVNGYLIASAVAQTNPISTSTFINTRLKTDSNGYLLVTIGAGGNPFFDSVCFSSSTKDSYIKEVGVNDLGIYTNATNCVTGTLRFDVSSTAVTSALPFLLPNGTVGAPSLTFASDSGLDTGFFHPSENTIGVAKGGVLHVYFDGNVTIANGDAFAISSTASAAGTADIFFRRSAAKTLTIDTDGAGGALTLVDVKGPLSATILNAPTSYQLNSVLFESVTAPTIASGGCTSPAVTSNNGTAKFKITLGTTCVGVKTFTLTMPAAAHEWACDAVDLTTNATYAPTQSAAASATSVVITNYNRTTGIAVDFVDSEVLILKCSGG